MPVLVLDSGGVTALTERSTRAMALHEMLARERLWPPVVPTPVLVECLTGHSGRDANVNRLLRTCIISESIPESLARRAASIRARARRGSAVDALVVASAEPSGVVLTSDPKDLRALAAYALDVTIERV
jgi:predicted nucleic acid-binding protein